MSSQKAKELRALALSLSLVNDDLKNKRFLRKSEFYKESDRYKLERRAQQLAAVNLSNELKNVSPAVAGVLVNAVNNAPPEIVGHAGDGEIKEGDIKNRGIDSMSFEDLKDAIKNLQKIPERKPAAKRERALSDEIFSEMLDKKINDVYKNFNNAIFISPEQLQKADRSQLMRLQRRYQEMISGDEAPTLARAGKIIDEHLDIIEERLQLMKEQEAGEEELKERAQLKRTRSQPSRTSPKLKRTGSAPGRTQITPKPTKPKLKKLTSAEEVEAATKDLTFEEEEDKKPPAPKKRGPGRPPGVKNKPKTEEVVEKQFMKDTGKTKRGRPKKKQAGETKPPPIIIERTSEAPTAIEGEGFKDYMAYMKGRKPTKKMKKLILLIGSKRAGNNSHKLNVEIEKLIADLRQDLQGKINKHKAKSARKQASAVAMEKKKLLIREAAKKQMAYEKSLAQY